MYRATKILALLLVLTVAVLVLSGCGLVITSAEGEPSEPVIEEASAGQAGELRPINVSHVQVEVGVGSPIPVDFVVSGEWPGLCAQLARVNMTQGDMSFDYELLATPELEGCPPDQLGLPFRLALPLNVVELPEGSYTVTVNGVSAEFDIPVTPPPGP